MSLTSQCMRKAYQATLLLLMGATLTTQGDDDDYISQASFAGGAGSTATNADYTHISSWRQPTQTSISSGGDYVNASGFLAAVTDFNVSPIRPTNSVIITAAQFITSPALAFRLSIQTLPDFRYTVQFADTLTQPFWSEFLNTGEGYGVHTETNPAGSNFTFTDDFTPNTSGNEPINHRRFYRVLVTPAP